MKLLEDSPCSLVVTSAGDENLVFVNKSFEEQTGYRSEEVLGKNCRFLQVRTISQHILDLTSRRRLHLVEVLCHLMVPRHFAMPFGKAVHVLLVW